MQKEIGKVCAEGFAFFSKTNRLISHELKNILAIISETLGLLDELVELSERGRELKPERLRSMSDSIIEEVERANTVIRCMNTFAHSVDEFIREVDLNQTVSLMIKLTQLNPVSKMVKINFPETDPHIIFTSPFFLGNLLYHALFFALSAVDPDRHIQISLHATSDAIRIAFSGIALNGSESFPCEHAALLARAIGAEISSDISSGKFHIVLPEKMSGGPIETLLVK